MKKFYCHLLFILLSVPAISQVIIKGRVIDRLTREPLEWASLKLSSGNSTAVTDRNGQFTLSVATSHDTSLLLVVSFIGYQTIKVPVVTDQSMTIEMEKGSVNLQEVTILRQSASPFQHISKIDLNLQPVRSAQDILRTVPGLFIGQHQGGGKAEQIFLRGFDIDHGTDVNVSVDGMPVNMVSHAHGQGYADLHFLIPELTSQVDYGKGPYYTAYGNLGTAGYVSMNTVNTLDKNTVKLEAGRFNTYRTLAMIDLLSPALKNKGTSAYIASEILYSDGPFVSPQHFNRFNLFGKFNTPVGQRSKLSISASTLSSDWDASGQVPERAVKEGRIDRFGYIDSSEGGYTSRSNVNTKLNTYFTNGNSWENQAYYSRYHFNLHSNFTFFLNDPVNGDQIRQREGRNIYGYHSRFTQVINEGTLPVKMNYGAGFRFDQTFNSELSHTINRNTVLSYQQLGDIRELNAFAYSESTIEKGAWLFNLGLRMDHFRFSYRDRLNNNLESAESRAIISPKLNIQYTLSSKAQVYLKAGKGFHSNDSRVVVQNRGKEMLPAAWGSDLGLVWKPNRNMIVNIAAWYLYLDQEFVYVGDEGIVEAAGRTRRTGIDLSARYQFTKWLFADMNLNLARPRSIDEPKGDNYIPLAPVFTSTGGISWQMKNGWNGSLRYRHMADRAANEDKSLIARGYTITDLSVNYTRKRFEIGLLIENLFNCRWNETQFETTSRLRWETDPVTEIHFTPGVPFFPRIKCSVFF